MARPTKIEGNPAHPASLGGSDVFMQAYLLDLYHPERAQTPLRRGKSASWGDFHAHLAAERFPNWDETHGRGLRFLTGTLTSPTAAASIHKLLARYPEARWASYEPINRDRAREGARAAFGQDLMSIHDLSRADVILTIGADFLGSGPGDLRYARDFANRRRRSGPSPSEMNRLYTLESGFSITGASADERLAVPPSRFRRVVRELALRLGLPLPSADGGLTAEERIWVDAVSADLLAHRGKSVVFVGDTEPEDLHALGHWMNQRLDAIGSTVSFIRSPEQGPPNQLRSLVDLVTEMKQGKVDSLFILGTDPVLTAPAELGFAEALARVPNRYCHDVFLSATSFHSDWLLPQAHLLEDWGDALAFDGTVSLIQPAVAPLYAGKGLLELLSALLKRPGALAHEILASHGSHKDPQAWEAALRAGMIEGSAPERIRPRVSSGLTRRLTSLPEPASPGLELRLEPDPRMWDGRFSQNAWLRELPQPISQLTWDNAALIGEKTAQKVGIVSEDAVELELEGRRARAAVFVVPGHAEDTVSLQLGYSKPHSPADPHTGGTNAYLLRTQQSLWSARGLKLIRTGTTSPLASTQQHHEMSGSELVVHGTFSRFQADPRGILPPKVDESGHNRQLPNLYADFTYPGPAWAMVIDLTTCIGCQACTIACQAENNIPVVGKSEVRNRRELHWIRVDHYFLGSPAKAQIAFQPVPCMHCEKAPCEYVCPVMATVHDSSGLNAMVYNRCIGTRDCSNNCPYKVRRFNFLQYSEMKNSLKKLVYNPDVTVRERGVMEKCTYCIQRISAARITAGKENRKIRAGEVVPACAQACPTRAITFGDANNPEEQVTRLKRHPLNYDLLGELGTRPRTSYLARISNPNPRLEPGDA
jgi:molybdopterin-containing oxidoreductase family iron-sulfur binding subunit